MMDLAAIAGALKDSGPFGLAAIFLLALLSAVLMVRKNGFQEGKELAEFRDKALLDNFEIVQKYREERDAANHRADTLLSAARWWFGKAHDVRNHFITYRQLVKVSAIRDGLKDPDFPEYPELPELIEDEERCPPRLPMTPKP